MISGQSDGEFTKNSVEIASRFKESEEIQWVKKRASLPDSFPLTHKYDGRSRYTYIYFSLN